MKRHCKLVGIKGADLTPVPAPCMDGNQLPPEYLAPPGQRGDVAARIVLQCMCAARLTRPGTLWDRRQVNFGMMPLRDWTQCMCAIETYGKDTRGRLAFEH